MYQKESIQSVRMKQYAVENAVGQSLNQMPWTGCTALPDKGIETLLALLIYNASTLLIYV